MNQVQRLDKLYHRLLFINFQNKMPDGMKEFMELNNLEQRIMSIVFENNEIRISSVTKMLNKSKSTMTSAIKRLEQKKLLTRKLYVLDKRISLLKLTQKGISLQKEHIKYKETLFEDILLSLDNAGERDVFLELFEKILNNFENECCKEKYVEE